MNWNPHPEDIAVPQQEEIIVRKTNDGTIEITQRDDQSEFGEVTVLLHVKNAPMLVMAIIAKMGNESGAVSAAFAAYQKRITELETICAESYQVIGALAGEAIEHPEVQKALDNASQQRLVHQDLLPFPKSELPERKRPA